MNIPFLPFPDLSAIQKGEGSCLKKKQNKTEGSQVWWCIAQVLKRILSGASLGYIARSSISKNKQLKIF